VNPQEEIEDILDTFVTDPKDREFVLDEILKIIEKGTNRGFW
jgi:hypothetical protein